MRPETFASLVSAILYEKRYRGLIPVTTWLTSVDSVVRVVTSVECEDIVDFILIVNCRYDCYRFGPYFCEPIIAGLNEDGTPFICTTDLIGAK
jgi:20S proteasome alpha/beta subunit